MITRQEFIDIVNTIKDKECKIDRWLDSLSELGIDISDTFYQMSYREELLGLVCKMVGDVSCDLIEWISWYLSTNVNDTITFVDYNGNSWEISDAGDLYDAIIEELKDGD